MPRTLENHLAGVTADRPHPLSYRPDLPLNGAARSEDYHEGYDAGYKEGSDDTERELNEDEYERGKTDALEGIGKNVREAQALVEKLEWAASELADVLETIEPDDA